MLNHSSGSFVTLEMEGQVGYIASGYTHVLRLCTADLGR